MAERSAIAAVLGLVLGAVASRALFLQWLTLIPWAVAAVAIGGASATRRQAIVGGAIYGYCLGFTAFGYGGADPIISRIPFFALLGALSAVFGAGLSLAAHALASRIRGRSKDVDRAG